MVLLLEKGLCSKIAWIAKTFRQLWWRLSAFAKIGKEWTALMSSSRKCANNPYTSAATPQIKDTTLINCDTIVENMQFKQNLDRLYLDCGQLCQSDKTCTNCCKDNVHSDAFGKIIMAFFAVSTAPLSHCILKQLLGNPRNCKNIINFTQSTTLERQHGRRRIFTIQSYE